MTLLGEIVEEISGISYEEYIRQNILIPLGLNDTRTELPEALYGGQLAIGYSALNRNAEREKVNFFQANGIKPAAGLSSDVLDLGKFASWQFQLMDNNTAEILKPSTLRYMYNVHWADPDVHWSEPYWKMNWGLGFMVFEDQDKSKLVGHGGDCPGYRSFLILDPESKMAVAVMINANGTSPEKYAAGIIEIIQKAEADEKKKSSENEEIIKNLQEYSGYLSNIPWESELFISEWNGNLVSLNLPSESPVKSITFFRHIEGDTFRRIRDDCELGETLVFERNAQGEITQFKQHNNYSRKINH